MSTLYAHIPEFPGVYLMKNKGGELLYIGKAANLKRRVSSYFLRPPASTRSNRGEHDYRIQKLVSEIARIDFQKTDTALEALILESRLIKEHQPPYNIREKDDKSFLYVEITREKFPRVLLIRGKEKNEERHKRLYGPFTSASQLREALRILRKIFPYSLHPVKSPSNKPINKACFDYQIGLCPGTCVDAITREEYGKIIKNLILFFEGGKKKVIRNFTKEMRSASKALEFEKAVELRRRIFALQHIQDIALISENEIQDPDAWKRKTIRIEGYDISNISGTSAVGSMVVFTNGKPNKNEYRKFRIKSLDQPHDVGMLKEVLRRRFAHGPDSKGWALPSLVLVDGGRGQVHATKSVLKSVGLQIPVVGIAKGPTRKKNEFVGAIPFRIPPEILVRVRDEAHRFAIRYHRNLRGRRFLRKTSEL